MEPCGPRSHFWERGTGKAGGRVRGSVNQVESLIQLTR